MSLSAVIECRPVKDFSDPLLDKGESMKQFMALCDAPVVLEVEMPTEEMSKRRIGFYERLGYVLDDHVYFQPPYRQGEPLLEMRLMTYGAIDLKQSFEEVKNCIHRYVYGVNE